MPDEVEWRRLRADELRERAQHDAMVILPVGSLEQHGPHLPVEVDSLLGETIAIRTATWSPSAASRCWCCRCCGPASPSTT
jgi:creatinine amidohydrolase